MGAYSCAVLALGLVAAYFGAGNVRASVAKTGKEAGLARTIAPKQGIGFVENKGQWADQALFYAGAPGLDVWMNRSGIVYDLYRKTMPGMDRELGTLELKPSKRSGHVVAMDFLGSRPQAQGRGVNQLEGHMNYIRGNRSATNVGMFEEAWLDSLYDGISLRMYADQGKPRFDLIVDAGADPSQIAWTYRGAYSVKPGPNGTILLGTRFGDLAVADLMAFQNGANGRVKVSASFNVGKDGVVRLNLGSYDRNRDLVIDPVVYSTLFGSFGIPPFIPGNDIARAVAVDQFNNAYVTGQTDCPFYPVTSGAYDNSVAGTDAFITKFKSDATSLIYSTVIGGGGTEIGLGIAVDSQGRAHIAGETNSVSDVPADAFPTTDGAPQRAWGGGIDPLTLEPLFDAFAARLSADGTNLEFGTYIGGNGNLFQTQRGNDVAYGIGLDADGNMYIAGQAESNDFPTTNSSLEPNPQGLRDGFVVKITADLVFDWSTFIGGSSSDTIRGIAVDPAGYAHLTGSTSSANYPTTAGAFDRTVQNGDAFVTKLVPTGDDLEFSTVIGGSASDAAVSIAIDSDGNSYICGATQSVDFPRTWGCYDNAFSPDFENFVTKVALDGASLRYSTFMNGGGTQTGIAVDDQGVAHICGIVLFPVIATTPTADDPTYNGPNNPLRIGDAYLQALNEAGSDLVYGSYFGGEEDDGALGMTVDHSRNAYFVGFSNSWTEGTKNPFPTTPGVFKPAMSNDNAPNLPFWDAFLIKAKVRPAPIIRTFTIAPVQLAGTEKAVGTITLSQPASPGGAVITLASDNDTVAWPDNGGTILDTIIIPEGADTATFDVATADVTQTYTVNITAELEGDRTIASLTVAPWLTNLSLSPNSIIGGNKVTGRVTLYRPAPQAGIKVEVTSSNTSVAYAVDTNDQPITDFTVPAGNTSNTFTIKTRGVDSTTTVSILTRIIDPNLAVVRSQLLTIRPAKLKSLTFNPTNVNGGQRSVGTITLDGETGPTPVRFDLTLGTGTAPVTVPTPITVGARKTFVNFYATTGFVTSNSFRNVIATRQSDPTQTKQGTLFVDAIDMSGITLSSNNVQGGAVVTGFLELTRPASTGGFTFNITSSNPTVAPIDGTGSMTIPAGALRSSNFVIRTKVIKTLTNVTITASKAGYTSRTASLTIRPVSFTLDVTPTTVVGGEQNVTGTITMSEAPNSSVTISLTSSSPAALSVPASVTITNPNTTANFTGTTSVVVSDVTVTITASTPAVPTALTATKQVLVQAPPPRLTAITFTPSIVVGGNTVLGRVILERPAPAGGVVVTLSKDPNATGSPFVTIPTTVTIPAGARNVAFNITTTQPSRTVATTITASTGPNAPTVSRTLTITRS